MRDREDLARALAQSPFRQRFKLGDKDLAYLHAKGFQTVQAHARDFIARKLAPAAPVNDGKQTPMRGHPVFIAQHATATCCRGCLEKWHFIPRGRVLTEGECEYVSGVIGAWLSRELARGPQPAGGEPASVPKEPAPGAQPRRGRKCVSDAPAQGQVFSDDPHEKGR